MSSGPAPLRAAAIATKRSHSTPSVAPVAARAALEQAGEHPSPADRPASGAGWSGSRGPHPPARHGRYAGPDVAGEPGGRGDDPQRAAAATIEDGARGLDDTADAVGVVREVDDDVAGPRGLDQFEASRQRRRVADRRRGKIGVDLQGVRQGERPDGVQRVVPADQPRRSVRRRRARSPSAGWREERPVGGHEAALRPAVTTEANDACAKAFELTCEGAAERLVDADRRDRDRGVVAHEQPALARLVGGQRAVAIQVVVGEIREQRGLRE